MSDTAEKFKHETVLDVRVQPLARVYAEALLGAAEAAGQLDEVVETVDSLVDDVLDANPRFEQVLASALVSAEDKERLLQRVFEGRASQVVLFFLKVLARHGRIGLLRNVRQELHTLYNRHRNRVEVEVRTPRELDNGLLEEIRTALQQKMTAEPILNVQLDPALLGGVVIRVGDTVYDGSVATRLRRSQAAMVRHAVDLIQTKRDRLITD